MTYEEMVNFLRSARVTADDATALSGVELYPLWESGIPVKVDDRYQHNNVLYRCVQAHTTQADWTPDITPALWAVVSLEEWPEWVQPAGAHDAYIKGAKVTHKDERWVSDIDANVWEPGIYGWTKNNS